MRTSFGSPVQALMSMLVRRRGIVAAAIAALLPAMAGVAGQADMKIRRDVDVTYAGNNHYSTNGIGQTKTIAVTPSGRAVFYLAVENDGAASDSFVIRGNTGDANWIVRYFDAASGGDDITPLVVGRGWTNGPLMPNAVGEFMVEATPRPGAAEGSAIALLVRATPKSLPANEDAAKAVAWITSGAIQPVGGMYTTNADFDCGVSVGVEYNSVPDQLQLTRESVTLPFIWVPNTTEGTVSKIDTRTGAEIGRYRTGPASVEPSRTSVDQQGNCWAANRAGGTVTKVGLYENGQYIDRNTNGTIETSRDLNGDGDITGAEILPWGQDECVLVEFVTVPGLEGPRVPGTFTQYAYSSGPRTVAVDANNNVWIGTYSTRKFYYINGTTAAIIKTIDVSSAGHTPYGGLIDGNGILWSSSINNHVLWLNPTNNTFGTVALSHCSYGVGIGRDNRLYASGWSNGRLSRINVNTKSVEWTKSAVSYGRGVAVTDDGDIWVANSNNGTVSRWGSNGVVKANIQVGRGPMGVAVDSGGNVWVANYDDCYVRRINPATGAVDILKKINNGYHYAYSDMCGTIARTATTRLGTWTVTHDARVYNTAWGKVAWTATTPANTLVGVRARSSNNQQTWSTWCVMTNNVPFSMPNGRYLQAEVTLQCLSGTNSPIVHDVAIFPAASIVAFDPEDDSVGIHTNANLVVTYSTNVAVGTGSISIRNGADGSVFESVPIGDARVVVSSNSVAIDPAGTFAEGAPYYVLIDNGALADPSAIGVRGIADPTTWNFVTMDSVVPTGVTASDGTYSNKVAVSWTAVSNAIGYQVYRSATNSTMAGMTNLTPVEITATNLDDYAVAPADVYWYWVRVRKPIAGGGTTLSGYSVPDSGYAMPANLTPDKPINLSPANAARRIDPEPALRASDFADPDTDSVHTSTWWQVTTIDDTFFATLVWDSGILVMTNLVTVPMPPATLECNTRYQWRVRYRDDGGAWSEWSDPTWFDTVKAPTNEAPVAVAVLQVSRTASTNLPGMQGPVVLDGSESYDDRTDTTNLFFDWREDVENPVQGLLTAEARTSMMPVVSNFPVPGVYCFLLAVNDGEYNSGIACVIISVPGMGGYVRCEGYEGMLPVYGVTLTTTNTDTGRASSTTTDANGHFYLDSGVGWGRVIEMERHGMTKTSVVNVPEEGLLTAELWFPPSSCVFYVSVSNAAGGFVSEPRAQLVVGDKIGITCPGDLAGSIGFGGIPELYPVSSYYVLRVQKEGFSSAAIEVQPQAGTTMAYEVVLTPEPNCIVTGIVVSTTGDPVPGTRVQFGFMFESNVYADVNGLFVVSVRPGSYCVELSAPNFLTTFDSADVPHGVTSCMLAEPLVISGGVFHIFGQIGALERSGVPVTNATIEILGRTASLRRAAPGPSSSVAGYYDMPVAPGLRTLRVTAPGYATYDVTINVTNDPSYAASKTSRNGNMIQDVTLILPEPAAAVALCAVCAAYLRRSRPLLGK